MSRRAERVAAIDVGSNTILLLIAEYQPAAGLTIIEEAEDQPRLGAGLSASGRLSEAAIERALHSLTRMRDICRSRRVTRIGAVATAAVREAQNRADFVQRVRELGLELQIISPETEAALSYRSAAYHFPSRQMLVADIGGGSVELIGAADGLIRLTDSLPLGAVRLTELTLALPALRHHIRRALEPVIQEADWSGSRVIGSGGTFANLGSMLLARRGPAAGKRIHGAEISAAELESLLAELAAMSPDQRRQVPGLKPERADIIVAGLAVAAELLDRVGANAVTVSGFGLREGLVLEMVGLE